MNAVYAANVHFGRCFGCQVIANGNKTMCEGAVQSIVFSFDHKYM